MGLQQNLHDEPVSKLAIREPVLAVAQESLREVIGRMREKRLGCAIVIDDDRKPIGIFTESVLTQLLSQQGALALEEPVEQHMASPCPCVKATDPIMLVVEAMQLKNIRFICVLDEAGCVSGLTGQKGMIEFVADHFPDQVMVQRIGGKPYPNTREGA